MKKICTLFLLLFCGIVFGQTILQPYGGGTGFGSYTPGDILYATGAKTLAKLPVGSNGTVLSVGGGIPTWTTISTTAGNWNINGNSNGSVKYIGTNDNYDFPIYANGMEIGKFKTDLGLAMTNNNYLSFSLATNKIYGSGSSLHVGADTYLQLETGGGNRAILIDGSQNVMVGTSAPTSRLHVIGSGHTSSTLAFQVWDNLNDTLFYVRNDGLGKFIGSVQIQDGTQGNGKVFTSDANGKGSWQTSSSGGVTNVATGTGLTGGPITSTGTVSLSVPVVIANGGTNNTSTLTTNGINYFDGTKITNSSNFKWDNTNNLFTKVLNGANILDRVETATTTINNFRPLTNYSAKSVFETLIANTATGGYEMYGICTNTTTIPFSMIGLTSTTAAVNNYPSFQIRGGKMKASDSTATNLTGTDVILGVTPEVSGNTPSSQVLTVYANGTLNSNGPLNVGTSGSSSLSSNVNVLGATNGAVIQEITNTTAGSAAYTGLYLTESASNFGAVNRFSSNYSGNYGGTTFPIANFTRIISLNGGTYEPVGITGLPVLFTSSGTSSNWGARQDNSGFRIDLLSNLNTSNNAPFAVGTGFTINSSGAVTSMLTCSGGAASTPQIVVTAAATYTGSTDGALTNSSSTHHLNVVLNGTSYQLDQQGVSNYAHSISTPTAGATVNLVKNTYNIINPAGALASLTVNLPSSPSNNDVVYIKYTQAITAVTYANGTVVDGITAPTAGGLVVLVYDSGTSSWY